MMETPAYPTPQFGPREQTREQRQFIISQSVGITRSQGPYEVPDWQAKLHEQYVEGLVDLDYVGARHDEYRAQLIASQQPAAAGAK
ncbi:hypothetical protein [Hymenobacter edaphi]|uniref:Antitoxin VbhA domain-containing protein n=1 Tax=Hymenobacter edaphi TaxID=2211146 RepID=A0A328B5C0_9BACT|nr:hypothetical protein [Hymenobacter edaphi]RAK62602.1 hypothetical protein DLM85_23215 [Hymenobacter edaphi]